MLRTGRTGKVLVAATFQFLADVFMPPGTPTAHGIHRQYTVRQLAIWRHPARFFRGLDGVHLEVQKIIRSTGKFVDDLTARYFRDFHGHLPIISRTRFQSNLIATGASPSADSSVLLLTICLIAYLPSSDRPPREGDKPNIGRQSLYLATKALLAQVQGYLQQPSIRLIQASLLLATYEYANGRPEVALVTIAGCARMAYAARIHNSRRHNMDGGSRLEVEEAGNTWWGIVISERVFICDAGDFGPPMATILPSGDTRLPIDRDILDREDLLSPDSIPDIPVSCLTSTSVISANLRSLEEWKKSSLAALDTATTMVIDMAKWHYSSLPSDGTNDTSPIHIYVVRASMEHMRLRPYDGDRPWSESAVNELQLYLDKLRHQWVASHD
ncbi:hypothetical protein ETB97_005652 [Aspergillus alliaceus]|uniref:Xylanolytic transcriptional activator regulatory domain-containing protein n=1 Tax=Petromyces alliaceus TaxID=209559 RepID=A0A8H6E325_PETAA|nr:hypothetical protein ETB97_005652 [Aspergillus burnettii]